MRSLVIFAIPLLRCLLALFRNRQDQATISRYVPRPKPDPTQQQRWMTFLRNHRDGTAAMDFFVVPTISFRLLYVCFIIDHERRRIIHFKHAAQRNCSGFGSAEFSHHTTYGKKPPRRLGPLRLKTDLSLRIIFENRQSRCGSSTELCNMYFLFKNAIAFKS